MLAATNATIRQLYRIMSGVIVSLYGSNLGCNDAVPEKEVVTRILKLEQDLADWLRDLPPELSLISSATARPHPDSPPGTRRFRVVITLRYLNLQVFLHRPALVKCIDQRGDHNTGSHVHDSTVQLQAAHIQTCFACGNEIIDIVHSIVSQGVKAKECLGAWWFSLYYGEFLDRLRDQRLTVSSFQRGTCRHRHPSCWKEAHCASADLGP